MSRTSRARPLGQAWRLVHDNGACQVKAIVLAWDAPPKRGQAAHGPRVQGVQAWTARAQKKGWLGGPLGWAVQAWTARPSLALDLVWMGHPGVHGLTTHTRMDVHPRSSGVTCHPRPTCAASLQFSTRPQCLCVCWRSYAKFRRHGLGLSRAQP
jgi:hypothetical protein